MSVFGALARNGSFAKLGFSVGLCGFANVPFVRWQNFNFCAVGKKIKHEGSGNECRLTRCPFVVSFLCLWSPVKMVYFLFKFRSSVQCLQCRFTIGYNGFGLCVRAGFGAQSFNLLLKVNRSTKLQACTSARLTQNPC